MDQRIDHRCRCRGRLSASQALLLGLTFPFLALAVPNDVDEDERAPAPQYRERAVQVPGQPVRLSPERQRLAGISVIATQAATLSPETAVQGKIVDITPLLELRTRYRATLAESRIAATAMSLAQKNRDRLAKLNQEAIIATKDLILAESTLAAEQTRAETTQQRLREIREEAVHSWGGELFRLAIAEDSKLWENLLQRRQVLALVALPASQALPVGTRSVYIARNRDRQHAVRAELLSPAPNTDALVQGETYFFHLDAGRLRTGMRIDAWISRHGESASGVFLPASGVVWYGGLPWVYVQLQPDAFQRRALERYDEYGDGWFVRSGLAGGERIVSVGAQLLLSEEMRGQIPDEDDD